MWGFFLRIVTSIVLTGISAFLSYRNPPRNRPGTLEDLGNPRADEGTEIPKVFGTVNIADPSVVWFGDLRTRRIEETTGRKYGLFGPKNKVTVGYEYFLGVHFVLCLGPIDNLSRIRVDKRIAWEGVSTGGRIEIRKLNLFGSRRTTGGINGDLDLLMGEGDQAVNDYLAAKASAPTPAYRGVTSLVLRGVYIGNAPTLRPWDMNAQRVFAVDDGYNSGSQWYPETAAIARPSYPLPSPTSYSLATTFPLLISGDPGYPTPVSNYPASITIGPFAEDREIVAGPGGARADDRFVFNGTVFGTVDNFDYPSGTVFYALPAGSTVTVQVQNNLNVLSEAVGSLVAVPPIYAINTDMNPVHILREVLLSPDTGGTGNDAEAGTTWTAAADTIFAEGFGISIAWRGDTDRAEFKREIERHIDARSYVDRRTGLWEIKLIRNDYDEGTLPVFDTSNVASWSNINFPQPASLINQLVVTWNDPDKDEKTSLTISNPARIRMAGSQVFQEKVEYPGINRPDLAGRVAARDLSARSAPLVTGEFTAKNFPTDINLGDPIIINNPRLGLVNKVVRVTEIDDGTIRDSKTTVKFIEDRFSIADESPLEIESPEPEVIVPLPVDPRLVEEAPLYLLTEQLGEPNVTEVFTTDPEAGFVFIAGGEPTPTAFDAVAFRDLGAGYEELETVAFSPEALTLGAMANRADHTQVVVETSEDLTTIAVGAKVWLGGEQMVVQLVEEGDTSAPGDYWEPTEAATLTVYTITLARGAMDTVPTAHAAGSQLIFYDDGALLVDDIQTDGDVVAIKLLTNEITGVLDIGDAPEDTVTMASRALRPYPPGRFKLDGSYEQDTALSTGVLTWVERNRLTDTGATPIDHDDAGVTSEAGVTYRVRVDALDGAGDVLSTVTDTNVGALLTYSWDTATSLPGATTKVRFRVTSVRDGYESWQSPFIRSEPPLPPYLLHDSADELDPESQMLTEIDEDFLIQE